MKKTPKLGRDPKMDYKDREEFSKAMAEMVQAATEAFGEQGFDTFSFVENRKLTFSLHPHAEGASPKTIRLTKDVDLYLIQQAFKAAR